MYTIWWIWTCAWAHVTLTTIKMINASIASRCFLCLSAGLGPCKTRGQVLQIHNYFPFSVHASWHVTLHLSYLQVESSSSPFESDLTLWTTLVNREWQEWGFTSSLPTSHKFFWTLPCSPVELASCHVPPLRHYEPGMFCSHTPQPWSVLPLFFARLSWWMM